MFLLVPKSHLSSKSWMTNSVGPIHTEYPNHLLFVNAEFSFPTERLANQKL